MHLCIPGVDGLCLWASPSGRASHDKKRVRGITTNAGEPHLVDHGNKVRIIRYLNQCGVGNQLKTVRNVHIYSLCLFSPRS